MSVVVGYIPNRYGEAALEAGVEEARRRNTRLVVVNSSKGDAYIDTKFANADQLADLDRRLSNLGIETTFGKVSGPTSRTRCLPSWTRSMPICLSSASDTAPRSARC